MAWKLCLPPVIRNTSLSLMTSLGFFPVRSFSPPCAGTTTVKLWQNWVKSFRRASSSVRGYPSMKRPCLLGPTPISSSIESFKSKTVDDSPTSILKSSPKSTSLQTSSLLKEYLQMKSLARFLFSCISVIGGQPMSPHKDLVQRCASLAVNKTVRSIVYVVQRYVTHISQLFAKLMLTLC